ncbi:MAG: HDOD domain-containing protein, partial [Candidatus Hydrogenedentes bacterium]|nr:HDOD domain-containing protein [Candidatus Hydrogenedentota bacterium]
GGCRLAQDATMLLITCSCGQRMKVPSEALGKTATCVKCGERLRITVEATAPSAPAPGPKARSSEPGKDAEGGLTSTGMDAVHVLRQHGLVGTAAVEEASLVQQDLPKKTWDLLIDLGHVSSEDFHATMAKQKGIASIDLPNYHIPAEVVEVIPAELAHRGVLMPVDKLGKLLTLAMACPLDVEIIADVEAHTGLKVKPMLSTIDALKNTISKHYPLARGLAPDDDPMTQELHREFASLLERNEVARRVFEIDSLAPFAQTSERLKMATENQKNGCTLKAITEIIATDPVATALLLRVSNSEAYGFSRRVDGLGLACTLLGPVAARAVVESVEGTDYLAQSKGFDFDAFWRRAHICSEAAQSIASALNSQVAITVYTAALLHEIGRLALLRVVPKSYPSITAGKSGPERAVAESRAYQLTAAEAGYILTRKWNMPLTITEPIRFQREPRQAKRSRDITPILTLAVLMADAHEIGASSPNLNKADTLIARLGIGKPELAEIFAETVFSVSEMG